MKSPKEFNKHLERLDLEPSEKQIKKLRKKHRRPELRNVLWFYAGLILALIIINLIQYL